MSEAMPQVIADTIAFLTTLNRDAVRPREAQARLRLLQAPHADVGMHLVWDEQAYDGSVHYDALLHLQGGATISLSIAPDRALPWPLRGVHRWSDADLLRVDGTLLKVEQAVTFLDCVQNEAPMRTRLIDVCLIQRALDQDSTSIGDAELQGAIDAFRLARGLGSAEATHRWMQDRGMTHEELERSATDERRLTRLRDRIAEGRVERYFADHRAAFDTLRVARIDCADEASAQSDRARIAAGEVDFYRLAEERFLAAAGPSDAPAGMIFATLRASEVTGAEAKALFAAAPGEVVGPIHTERGPALVRVLSRTTGELDEATRTAIREILFEEWLADQRRDATVAWNWGRAA